MDFAAIYYTILVLVSVSFLSIIVLTISHLVSGDTCPKMLGIPACYLLTPIILLMLILHLNLIGKSNLLFFIACGITILVAVVASISQIRGTLECPKLFGKIPMCYLSFLTFGTVLVLKIIEINL